LAGLPRSVVAAAQRILSESPEHPGAAPRKTRRAAQEVVQPPLPLFEPEPDPLREDLEALDLNRMTPLEVMNWVAERQRKANR
jgi:DNA mismatch repair protein MutS